ncbi:putative F-box domain-containing protein [Rosa chinensis]|uniref:Putative F-box domain-containing protein n=1 Tax=Rosa chinensis TaxID=74649 RepID=A0A2P6PTX0_ROSCH|nr:putative F-box domain-containing protein [Rosa chinensis]
MIDLGKWNQIEQFSSSSFHFFFLILPLFTQFKHGRLSQTGFKSKMPSNSKRLKLCSHNEDRINGFPDAILCHILSFFSIRQAVKTSILSHKWRNVWA